MHRFGECFRESISNSLNENGFVIVVIFFKFLNELLDSDAGSNSKESKKIIFQRGNKIGERKIGLSW